MVMHTSSSRLSFRLRTRKELTALRSQKMAQKMQKAQLKEKEEQWSLQVKSLEHSNMMLQKHARVLKQVLDEARCTIQQLELKLDQSEKDLIREKTLGDERRDFYLVQNRKNVDWHIMRTEERMSNMVKEAQDNLKIEVEKSKIFEKRVEKLEEDIHKFQQANPESVCLVPIFAHCQICNIDYSQVPDRVPRVLECGHSVCTSCATHIAGSSAIKCPFDRKPTTFQGKGVTSLPKNFTILEMMEDGYKS